VQERLRTDPGTISDISAISHLLPIAVRPWTVKLAGCSTRATAAENGRSFPRASRGQCAIDATLEELKDQGYPLAEVTVVFVPTILDTTIAMTKMMSDMLQRS